MCNWGNAGNSKALWVKCCFTWYNTCCEIKDDPWGRSLQITKYAELNMIYLTRLNQILVRSTLWLPRYQERGARVYLSLVPNHPTTLSERTIFCNLVIAMSNKLCSPNWLIGIMYLPMLLLLHGAFCSLEEIKAAICTLKAWAPFH